MGFFRIILRDTEKEKMTKLINTLIAFLVVFMKTSQAYEPSLGSCPDLRGLRNFTVENYTGRWYEYSRVFLVPEAFGVCVRATYTDNGDGTVGVFNEQLSSLTGVYNAINGSATPADSQYAEFIVNFDSVPVQNSRPNYRVLATDYLNYAIVYDCLDIFGLFKAESLWFLTRSQLPDAKLVDEGYRLMEDWELPVSSLKVTRQTDCGSMPSSIEIED